MAQWIGGRFWYYKTTYINIFLITLIKKQPEAVKVSASTLWGRKFKVVWSKNFFNKSFADYCKEQNLKVWAKSVHIRRSYDHFHVGYFRPFWAILDDEHSVSFSCFISSLIDGEKGFVNFCSFSLLSSGSRNKIYSFRWPFFLDQYIID